MITDIIDVFIGVILTFATMSLAASSVTEAIASVLKWRAATLVTGLQQLLNDPNLTGLANAVLNHGAVNPRGAGNTTGAATANGTVPSYIAPLQFASALLDVLQTVPPAAPGQLPPINAAVSSGSPQASTRQDIATSIDRIPDAQLRTLFQGICTRANGDIDKIRTEFAKWFDAGMDRVSGAYKRKSQLVSFLVALAIAIALNVSTFRVAETIWAHPKISENLNQLSSSNETGLKAIENFKAADFPFGWEDKQQNSHLIAWSSNFFEALGAWLLLLLGWSATAVATLFGAPFWFDTLQKFVKLGGTGPKPDPTPDPKPAST